MDDNRRDMVPRERIHERPSFAIGAVLFLFAVAILWMYIAHLTAGEATN